MTSCNPGQQWNFVPCVPSPFIGAQVYAEVFSGPASMPRPQTVCPTLPHCCHGRARPLSSRLDLQPRPTGHSAAICSPQCSLSQSGHFQRYNRARHSPSRNLPQNQIPTLTRASAALCGLAPAARSLPGFLQPQPPFSFLNIGTSGLLRLFFFLPKDAVAPNLCVPVYSLFFKAPNSCRFPRETFI